VNQTFLISPPGQLAVRLLGSRAYGTNIETSDYDWRGICIAPITAYLGLDARPTTYMPQQGGQDVQFWEFRQFMFLASHGNPTALEFLYADTLLISATPEWQRILERRHLFLTRRFVKAAKGYAYSMAEKASPTSKDLMQALRLAWTLTDLQTTGELRVRRPDDQVSLLLDTRMSLVDEAEIGYVKDEVRMVPHSDAFDLPDEPSVPTVNELMVDILTEHWRLR
jgi:hypothetical protein